LRLPARPVAFADTVPIEVTPRVPGRGPVTFATTPPRCTAPHRTSPHQTSSVHRPLLWVAGVLAVLAVLAVSSALVQTARARARAIAPAAVVPILVPRDAIVEGARPALGVRTLDAPSQPPPKGRRTRAAAPPPSASPDIEVSFRDAR
jgi:hypothetical protein